MPKIPEEMPRRGELSNPEKNIEEALLTTLEDNISSGEDLVLLYQDRARVVLGSIGAGKLLAREFLKGESIHLLQRGEFRLMIKDSQDGVQESPLREIRYEPRVDVEIGVHSFTTRVNVLDPDKLGMLITHEAHPSLAKADVSDSKQRWELYLAGMEKILNEGMSRQALRELGVTHLKKRLELVERRKQEHERHPEIHQFSQQLVTQYEQEMKHIQVLLTALTANDPLARVRFGAAGHSQQNFSLYLKIHKKGTE